MFEVIVQELWEDKKIDYKGGVRKLLPMKSAHVEIKRRRSSRIKEKIIMRNKNVHIM